MTEQNKKDTIIKFVKFIDSCYDITITISCASYDEIEEKMIIDADIFGDISKIELYVAKDRNINFNYIYNLIVDYTNKKIIESFRK